ncbi:MAG TPA: glycosyltransferase family 2 protein [Sporichthyaceae bacterium]|jgi:cellulose synthase/poly-beta-1,6-N-acetylglucosamine synthase-like glycosyltransferase|nr:glycosyltransferase family 2 protein [Sporichthyaceae bacterium]
MSAAVPSPYPPDSTAAPLRVIAIVPAYNEEAGLGDTLRSLLAQDTPFDEIIVVDDGSADRTAAIARAYGVTVLRPERNLGSKAKAQNYALAQIVARPESDHPDLVVPVDADTVFARDYLTEIQKPFTDPNVAIAGGSVLTRHAHTIWERGRLVEYLTGFHFYRQVQNAFDSPLVCSGCCSAFRLTYLVEFGGFPERTIVEDIDYTWSQQIMGRRAVYVHAAVAYAAEPVNLTYLRKQLNRWKHGYFQNVRIHWRSMLQRKKMLALWVNLSLFSIIISPLTVAMPAIWLLNGHSVRQVTLWSVGADLAILALPLSMGIVQRRLNPLKVLLSVPCFYVLKMINFWYDMKCFVIELILVPRGLATGLHHYEKGRSDDLDVRAGAIAAVQPVVTPPSVPAPRQRIRHESEPTTAPPTTAPSAPNRGEYDLDWSIERWREYLHSETTAAIDELNRELRSISEDCYPQLWRAT